jgi:hypothetical protein
VEKDLNKPFAEGSGKKMKTLLLEWTQGSMTREHPLIYLFFSDFRKLK